MSNDTPENPESSPPLVSDAQIENAGAAEAESSPNLPADGFESLALIPTLLQAVRDQGFEEPTPIQRRTIPLMLEGRDVIAQAQTGTGKTAAFALPLLQRLDVEQRTVQVMVLTPTRELAVQVAGAIYALGRQLNVSILPVYGGQPIERQLRALRIGVQVVIGTPGRILDHLRRGSLSLAGLKTLVLDEADEMLDMGFEEELEAILAAIPEERQTALFSATIPARIVALSRKYMHDPVRIAIESEKLTVPQIKQTYYEVSPQAKLDALCRILDMETPGSAIIFCRTKRDVDETGEALLARGYPADTIHGDLSQAMRDRVMRRFREGQAELLVATDVAARGLDIEQVSHVINFNIPEDPEQYIHRIGRTARAGRTGDAITLVTPREMRQLREIERLIRKKINPMRVPTAGDIAARRLDLTKEALGRTMRDGGLDPYMLAVEELAADGDLARVAAAALKLVMERDGGPRTTVTPVDGDAARGVETGMQRLFIDIGRKQGVRPSDIVGAIANEAGVPGSSIGAIDLYDSFTFVEVAQAIAPKVIQALQGATLHGNEFRVDVARPREEQPQEERGRAPENAAGPARRPAPVAVPDDEDDDDFEEDEQPNRRPAGLRSAPPQRTGPPRSAPPSRSGPRRDSNTGQRGSPPRRGATPPGRGGFGPFRGPEPREVPPWQRRQQQIERSSGARPARRSSQDSYPPSRESPRYDPRRQSGPPGPPRPGGGAGASRPRPQRRRPGE